MGKGVFRGRGKVPRSVLGEGIWLGVKGDNRRDGGREMPEMVSVCDNSGTAVTVELVIIVP